MLDRFRTSLQHQCYLESSSFSLIMTNHPHSNIFVSQTLTPNKSQCQFLFKHYINNSEGAGTQNPCFEWHGLKTSWTRFFFIIFCQIFAIFDDFSKWILVLETYHIVDLPLMYIQCPHSRIPLIGLETRYVTYWIKN